MEWLNIFGLVTVVLMLLPNMIYAFKNKDAENKCKSKAVNFIEQAGRYGSMLLMVFNIGIAVPGFKTKNGFVVWAVSLIVLLALYWLFWAVYFKKKSLPAALALAVIPSMIFVFSGIIMRHWLLIIFGLLFTTGHIYITYINNRGRE